MMKLEYLPIETDLIEYRPDNMRITLEGKRLQFITFWNPIGEFFGFELYDRQGEPIILGRKIVYRVDMLGNIVDDRLPGIDIIPLDPTGEHDKITFDNFMKEIKPYIFPAGDE